MEKLSGNFLNELFSAFIKSRNILEIAINHLRYEHLPSEEYKEVWKTISSLYQATNELPTYGNLSEAFKDRVKIINLIGKIKSSDYVARDLLLIQLEDFIKRTEFVLLYEKVGDVYQSGETKQAYSILQEGSEKINSFSLRSKSFEPIFKGFEKRYHQRLMNNFDNIGNSETIKCPIGIDSLDSRLNGGLDKGDTLLLLARSGTGKSTFLRWVGYYNARMGHNVMHIQLEGKKIEATNLYDTMFSGSTLQDMELTSLTEQRLNKAIAEASNIKGEVYIVAYEQFNTATMSDIRTSIVEHIKSSPVYPDVLIIDYIDKADPGNGKRYGTNVEGEKSRKQALADLFKNICVEFNLAGFTATQASNVLKEVWDNPDEVLTREHIKGDKNFIDPFSVHLTLNITQDEANNQVARIYEDKVRKYRGSMSHLIATAYEKGRFYDSKRTRILNITK